MEPNSSDGLYAAFLYGVNIPGGKPATGHSVKSALQSLRPSACFVRIVDRPDSILLWSRGPTTEDFVRRAVSEALDCPCVVVSTATLERLGKAALDALRGYGYLSAPPYRVTSDGVESELCLVLSSDLLPQDAEGEAWLFDPTRNAIALTVLERRALLARKRRFTPGGKRIMLGAALNNAWERVLERNGLTVACLTSRTLNKIMRVVAEARELR
jgi:hypothetical protein